MLAQAYMSLAVILAQFPVGADQLNEGGGGGGWVFNLISLVIFAFMYLVLWHPD